MTYSEISSLLSGEVPSGRTFLNELNIVRARLLQAGNWKGAKRQITMPVYSDSDGNSIVTLPREAKTILAGMVRSTEIPWSGLPMGVMGEFSQFDRNGPGYGPNGANFVQVPGRFCLFQDWETDSPMRLRFRFETSETAGTIHIRGTMLNERVYSLYDGNWIEGEKLAFTGTSAVTTVKYYDAERLSVVKPVTSGKVTMYALDDEDVETLVAVYQSAETVPQWKRYKVPDCEDVGTLASTGAVTAIQYYTKAELEALFADSGTITVSTSGDTDLVYSSYFLRTVLIEAGAGSGSYTRNFTLDTGNPISGAQFVVRLQVAQSANPVLNFYSESVSGDPLVTVNGDSSNEQIITLRFEFNGTDWAYEP